MAKWKRGDLVLVETDTLIQVEKDGTKLFRKDRVEILDINFSNYSVKKLDTQQVSEVAPERIYCRYIG